jgi:hypothetical protein
MSAELLPCLVVVQKEPSKLEFFMGSIMLKQQVKILIMMLLPELVQDPSIQEQCLFSQKKIPSTCFKLSQIPGLTLHLAIFINNGMLSQEKSVASSVIPESTTQILSINSLQNSSLITEARFIEKSPLQEWMLTQEIISFGTKQKRIFQKLLLVVHLFHLFSQINNGKNKVMLSWTVELFTIPIWSPQSKDAKKL